MRQIYRLGAARRWWAGLMVTATFVLAFEPRFREPETDAPLPAIEAARTMVVPEGFDVTLFAGEPDVRQPIGFCFDDRGRLWVAEAYNYPRHGTSPGDRVVIFEDRDGDGRFDERTVFYDQLNYVTGIEVGFGGAWIMSPPYFYFIPDRDGDDRPDGPPEVLLDGFGNHANSHNLANGFAWGPDGWLYGTHGRTNWSLIGKPGTPDDQRQRFDGGVYRFHPVRRVWEPFADGTTNPWGIDWDDYGQAFVCNCVNPHLFHVIQGAHYEPWRNRESSRYAYERIATIADHLHFVGQSSVREGLGSPEEDAAGGGHAHCGTMVYLGGRWPERYRNTVFMNNIHGHRINNDLLRRSGSGYVASHGTDLMVARDNWYMGVTLQYGPDGNVFVIDWSDTGECHSVTNTRRETGRIYKIRYRPSQETASAPGEPAQPGPFDLRRLSDLELVQLQLHPNDWYVRHARRLLQERRALGEKLPGVRDALRAMYAEQSEVPRQLRALWTLHVLGEDDPEFLTAQLQHASEYVRAWAVRLLTEQPIIPSDIGAQFARLARGDESAFVRLHLSCALQRLPLSARWDLAAALTARAEDAADQNLPLMNWYGIEPLLAEDARRFVQLAGVARQPLVRRHIARRAASGSDPQVNLTALLDQIAASDDVTVWHDLLNGILQGLEGQRSVRMPANWPMVSGKLADKVPGGLPAERELQERALELALVFDDPAALRKLRELALDRAAESGERNQALRALIAKHVADLPSILLELARDPATQGTALRGLAEYNDPATVGTILALYASLDAATRQDALQTLAARSDWAAALLEAVAANQIPRRDVTSYTVRQITSLGNADLKRQVVELWGEFRSSPVEKRRRIEDYRRRLVPEVLARADRSKGRAVFQESCANCHRLFDAGGAIGPNITGAQRTNLDYLLENLIDPSAAVARDFQMEVVETVSGRVVTGLVVDENDNAVTLQTINERIVVPLGEIERRSVSPLSMMPEGLLEKLPFEQVRDLLAYISGPSQVPLPQP